MQTNGGKDFTVYVFFVDKKTFIVIAISVEIDT